MNTFNGLRTRLGDRAEIAALALTDGDHRQAAVCTLHHRIPAGAWSAPAGAAVATIASGRGAAAGLLAALAVAAWVVQLVLDRAHFVAVAYPHHPCPRCPQPDGGDGRGDGGIWLDTDWDDGIPPAPAPMTDLSDDRIRAMAGDLDAQHAALIDNVRPHASHPGDMP